MNLALLRPVPRSDRFGNMRRKEGMVNFLIFELEFWPWIVE
jgi:hypothetical protein